MVIEDPPGRQILKLYTGLKKAESPLEHIDLSPLASIYRVAKALGLSCPT
jgi:hypothetical protein